MDKMEVRCPSCGRVLKTVNKNSGPGTVNCPKCKIRVHYELSSDRTRVYTSQA